MRGFRGAELGKPEPMNERTLFAIASAPRPSPRRSRDAGPGGKLGWNDRPPNTSRLQLYDPYVSANSPSATSSATGVDSPAGDGIWYASEYSREEVLRRVRYLKPSWSFRSNYGYQNIMFVAAGEIAGKLAGGGWDRAVRERLFLPLGMLETKPRPGPRGPGQRRDGRTSGSRRS